MNSPSQSQSNDAFIKACRNKFYIPRPRWLLCETCQTSALESVKCVLLDHKMVWRTLKDW